MNEIGREQWELKSTNGARVVTKESEGNSRPVGSISSTIGPGEADDRGFRSPEAVWLTAVCSTATTSGGEVEDFDLEGGADAEDSGVEICVVLGEASIPPCIARVVTVFGEVEGMRRLARVI